MTRNTRPAHGSGFVAALIVAIGLAVLIFASPASATSELCPGLDSGKIDTTGDPASVTITAPAGYLIDAYCVKAGTDAVIVDVIPPAAEVVITHPSGKAVSHYSYSLVPIDDGGTDGGTDGGSDGGTDGGSDGGSDGGTDGGTDGGSTTGGTGGGTTGGGSASGTTGGDSSATRGELPETGLPIVIPLLLAGALLGSGLFLLRRKGDAA